MHDKHDETTTGRQSSSGTTQSFASQGVASTTPLDEQTRATLGRSAETLTVLAGELRALLVALWRTDEGPALAALGVIRPRMHARAADTWRRVCDGEVWPGPALTGAIGRVTCVACLEQLEREAGARRVDLQRAARELVEGGPAPVARPVCPNCGQWVNPGAGLWPADCVNGCGRRGLAPAVGVEALRESSAEIAGMGRGAQVPGVGRRSARLVEALRDEEPWKLGEARPPCVTVRELVYAHAHAHTGFGAACGLQADTEILTWAARPEEVTCAICRRTLAAAEEG